MSTTRRKISRKYNNDHKELVKLGASLERTLQGRDRLAEAPHSQAALASLLELASMVKELKRLEKKVMGALKTHLSKGGCCQAGALIAQLQVTEKRSPSWKDEAILNALELAKCRKQRFDEEAYVERVKKNTPVSRSTKVKIEAAQEE